MFQILDEFRILEHSKLSNDNNLLNRLEIKYLFDKSYLDRIINYFYDNNYFLISSDGKKIVNYNNLYYDTMNLDLFKMSGDKLKIRVRKYDDGINYFEIKEKKNGIVIKKREHISEISDNIQYKNYDLYPCIYTIYDRIRFINNDLNLRASIDLNLKFIDYKYSQKIIFDKFILELKGEKHIIHDIKRTINFIDRISFSKYKYGIRSLTPNHEKI